ncbi:hypothetical protein MJO28_007986 [Puccinia striiformis f. sp. tritici]|uniref:Uncharacterized protein n=1 Tax=Puccinia striiformis f. sp. tritici TaxID=168172 RepID=A0ACC0ECI1_9BASI|nr:hypothetical protein MJO28_007986 [Puccinia striiformis f. sp. tritici]KAI7952286.1 hypothetical protein MJO29_007917 [Puccinia striiformis f. sp. tritici]
MAVAIRGSATVVPSQQLRHRRNEQQSRGLVQNCGLPDGRLVGWKFQTMKMRTTVKLSNNQ